MAPRTKTRASETGGGNNRNKEATTSAASSRPRSLEISDRGIKTGGDFADMMSALMSDLIAGRVTPQIGNATCNAGGKLLKVVEMQYKYGTTQSEGRREKRILALAFETEDIKPAISGAPIMSLD